MLSLVVLIASLQIFPPVRRHLVVRPPRRHILAAMRVGPLVIAMATAVGISTGHQHPRLVGVVPRSSVTIAVSCHYSELHCDALPTTQASDDVAVIGCRLAAVITTVE